MQEANQVELAILAMKGDVPGLFQSHFKYLYASFAVYSHYLYKINYIKMNIVRSWREQKIMLKRRFPILNDDDLEPKDGTRESVLKVLEIKLNKTKAELESLLAELQLY